MSQTAEPLKPTDKPHGKPTVSDVARRAGVSVATVSYVLNNRSSEVSRVTMAKVQDAMRELGYVKNLAAAALSGKKSKLIAVIIPGLDDHARMADDHEINPFYGEFILRLETESRAHGYALLVHGGPAHDCLPFLVQRNVDTAVLVGLTDPALAPALDREGIQTILYDSFADDVPRAHVRTNEVKGGYLAAERLIEIGKRRLLFAGEIRAGLISDVNAMRYRGACKACEMADAPPPEPIEVRTSFEDGYRAAEVVVNAKADGVVAPADIIAAGLLDGLQERGIRVPQDVAIVGYDNLPISRLVRPRLTTIDQGLADKVKAVISMIRRRETGIIQTMDPHIVIRDSA